MGGDLVREELMGRAMAGGLDAFTELGRRWIDGLYAVACLILGDSEVAADAAGTAPPVVIPVPDHRVDNVGRPAWQPVLVLTAAVSSSSPGPQTVVSVGDRHPSTGQRSFGRFPRSVH